MAGNFRWVVCALLFLATTVNYIDRQVIGILKPTLQQQYGWSEIDYADIVFSFQLAYAIGLLLAGRRSIVSARASATRCSCWCGASPRWRTPKRERYGPGVAVLLGAFGLAYAPSVAGVHRGAVCARPRRGRQLSRRSSRWPSGSR